MKIKEKKKVNTSYEFSLKAGLYNFKMLNDEVEIIEDESKKIEKLEIDDDWELKRYYLDLKGLNRNLIKVIKKQNEIIDYISSNL
jgi:hypothetical protein